MMNNEYDPQKIDEPTNGDEVANQMEPPTTAEVVDRAPPVELPDRPSAMQLVDALLKAPELVFKSQRGFLTLVVVLLTCHLAYGLIVGSYSGSIQWYAAPLKIALGTVLAGLICLPSLYIFAALSGARIHPAQTLSLLGGCLAITSVLLIGFAPIAFVFTFSIESLPFMGALHLTIWMVSVMFGVRYILRCADLLDIKNNMLIRVWAAILVITMLQMSTTMRPIIGESDELFSSEKRFFLVHWAEQMDSPPEQDEDAPSHQFASRSAR